MTHLMRHLTPANRVLVDQEHTEVAGPYFDRDLPFDTSPRVLNKLMEAARADERSKAGLETIVAAAMLYVNAHDEGDPRAVPVIVSSPPPARHHNLFIAYDRLGSPDKTGFLTSLGRFVEREEGARIARAAGQPIIRPDAQDDYLFSEDLW